MLGEMISVGIPVYNEERSITKCINSILTQLSDKDEIIVVASGCTDSTIPKIKEIMRKDKRIKLIIEKERKGKTTALNLIIKHAKNDIIVQTDGDVILEKDAIKYLLKHFKNPDVGAVSGNPIPIIPKSSILYEWTIMSYRKIDELRRKASEEGNFWHLCGYLLAFRRNSLKKLPLVKGAVDALMGRLIIEKGYKIVYEPKAKVKVKCPVTIIDFIKQKSRVRAGYFFVSSYGEKPRNMVTEIFFFPKELLKVNLKRWPAFFISAIIYFYTWIKGWFFYKKNKSLNEIWQYVESTK